MKLRFVLILVLSCFCLVSMAQIRDEYNLSSDSLATRWDEATPLGNGLLGSLVWKKQGKLRMSLDRADLWDDRAMPGIDKLTFKWVVDKVDKKEYGDVQKMGDEPYGENAAPTKIRGASLEFDISKLGGVDRNTLDLSSAVNILHFKNGSVLRNYVHATQPVGCFIWENTPDIPVPQLIMPEYGQNVKANANDQSPQSLSLLGYRQGSITRKSGESRYRQPTYEGHYYEVLVKWKNLGNNKVMGVWTIARDKQAVLADLSLTTMKVFASSHSLWWKDFWSRSSVSVPDPVIARQYYLDMYKFGSVARASAPPISLQAVWTADNGLLPPWKGDLHHDLNTQLSYWPGYVANHLDLTSGFTNWLWNVKTENQRWTKQYFGTDGLNVPGVCTISGKPMGGWIQYAMGPTTAAWLAQHFYWQWKYTNDQKFLKERCKPYFDEVAKYLRGIRQIDSISGKYKIPLSSSPEYNDNDISAWFRTYTNYDLALTRFFFSKYKEVTEAATGREARSISAELQKYPQLDGDNSGLTMAPGVPVTHSHRHHSHMIGIYPLKVLNYDIAADSALIQKSLSSMESHGTRAWVGYSFAWAASLYAQAREGRQAADMLHKFATNFVSSNSFHVNGDQKGGKFSAFTYRPFTLEGNFAFAQGVHEMLLQSSRGYIEVFPAVPSDWADVGFSKLRTEQGVLVSAQKKAGKIISVSLSSPVKQLIRIKRPAEKVTVKNAASFRFMDNFIVLTLLPGQRVTINKV